MLTCNWLRSVWVTMVNFLHRGALYCIETNVSRVILNLLGSIYGYYSINIFFFWKNYFEAYFYTNSKQNNRLKAYLKFDIESDHLHSFKFSAFHLFL